MSNSAITELVDEVWGPYPNYDDIARFEYGRRLWCSAQMRSRLRRHWQDSRHPSRERFLAQQALIEEVLDSQDSPEALNQRLTTRSTSLRAMAREIPPVFGSFFAASKPNPERPKVL